ncbi:hypothetical protein NLG97_g3759 [Lecanicillium saksenae]|uniref:Uncharacterized protein n=1 Tax=Lecanicillium saksenae TaxID=468837 RepID=A0ACC1QZ27_9HYPO|nr:hypothetical protein NLG97_g3759 [Lecanicillium saksenae]
MTGFHLRVALANRSLHLVHDHRHLIQARHRRPHIARSSRAPARLGLRSTGAAGPAAPSSSHPHAANYHHHRRRSSSSKLHLLQQRLTMASNQEIRRRSSAADRTPYDNPLSPTSAMAMSTTFSPTPDSVLAQVKDDEISRQQQLSGNMKKEISTEAMPPPPLNGFGRAQARQPPLTNTAHRARDSRRVRPPAVIRGTARDALVKTTNAGTDARAPRSR